MPSSPAMAFASFVPKGLSTRGCEEIARFEMQQGLASPNPLCSSRIILILAILRSSIATSAGRRDGPDPASQPGTFRSGWPTDIGRPMLSSPFLRPAGGVPSQPPGSLTSDLRAFAPATWPTRRQDAHEHAASACPVRCLLSAVLTVSVTRVFPNGNTRHHARGDARRRDARALLSAGNLAEAAEGRDRVRPLSPPPQPLQPRAAATRRARSSYACKRRRIHGCMGSCRKARPAPRTAQSAVSAPVLGGTGPKDRLASQMHPSCEDSKVLGTPSVGVCVRLSVSETPSIIP